MSLDDTEAAKPSFGVVAGPSVHKPLQLRLVVETELDLTRKAAIHAELKQPNDDRPELRNVAVLSNN